MKGRRNKIRNWEKQRKIMEDVSEPYDCFAVRESSKYGEMNGDFLNLIWKKVC